MFHLLVRTRLYDSSSKYPASLSSCACSTGTVGNGFV
eukprot:s85_g8.t1